MSAHEHSPTRDAELRRRAIDGCDPSAAPDPAALLRSAEGLAVEGRAPEGEVLRRLADQARALGALPRPTPPRALDEAVLAPSFLAECVSEHASGVSTPTGPERANTESGDVSDLLRSLPRHAAPAVLDRLVAEELASPEAARARRFAGDLERQATPSSLWSRVARRAEPVAERSERAPGARPFVLRGTASWSLPGLAAAAALLLWLGGNPRGGLGSANASPEDSPELSFSWRHATAEELSPLAASFGMYHGVVPSRSNSGAPSANGGEGGSR